MSRFNFLGLSPFPKLSEEYNESGNRIITEKQSLRRIVGNDQLLKGESRILLVDLAVRRVFLPRGGVLVRHVGGDQIVVRRRMRDGSVEFRIEVRRRRTEETDLPQGRTRGTPLTAIECIRTHKLKIIVEDNRLELAAVKSPCTYADYWRRNFYCCKQSSWN